MSKRRPKAEPRGKHEQGTPCSGCGNYCTCTCVLEDKHRPGCRFLMAAMLSVEIACDHGFQACPICDPCDCGAGQTKGVT